MRRFGRIIKVMLRDADALLTDALQLAPEARAALAASLLESIEEEVDEGVEDAWRPRSTGASANYSPVRSRPFHGQPCGSGSTSIFASEGHSLNGTDLTFHPKAAEELEASTAWYAKRSVPAAVQFVAKVEHAPEQVTKSPGLWPRQWAGEAIRHASIPVFDRLSRDREWC